MSPDPGPEENAYADDDGLAPHEDLPPGYDPDLHAPDLPLEEIDDVEIEEAPEDLREAWRYPFNPHPKQLLACSYLVDEMLFGGSAGPGKRIGHWQNA